MRTNLLIAAIFLLVASAVFADNTARHVATEELMQYMDAKQALEVAKQRTRILTIEMQFAGSDMSAEEKIIAKKYMDKLFDELDKEVPWDAVKPAYIAIFEEVFTESEINGILNFYKSEAGKAFKEKFPTLTLKLIQAGQQVYGTEMLKHEQKTKQITEDMTKEIEGLRNKKK